ncbi:LacI family DNA-binding transcriptional regulator [Demequina zhanjiangensis]|uniref:LacI family DNA-binding transcriptional regulator n=1 Tax=Demequina zhanjiangensis TaxID=3051659 RepID=A0ABT8G1Y7_9MICO|nr:LacI family DNA-binding transcriptional regulator [Demequina sp. SYSU T00b26]MDN4472959.1 LacI family DNA-binding transcriptional regulator [Demequina sp. SYSU T00b26]
MAEDEGTRAATIFDVARLAGVSHQTVSRVLNGLPNVRPATEQRVREAIAQLHYSPSPAARALVTRRTRTIGLITPNNVDHGPASIAMHVNIAAREARYSVDAVSTAGADASAVRASIEALLRQRVDAVVVVVADVPALEVVSAIDVSVPVVASASVPRPGPRIVSIDQYRGARAAVAHLAEQGHTRILHVAGPAGAPDANERVRGWRDELAARRLEIIEPEHGDWTAASGFGIGGTLDLPHGSAVFVSNDQMAIGLMSALRQRGLHVPEDVSIVGFDDIPEAGYLFPPLTTVRQDFAALGRAIVQKVLVALDADGEETIDTPLPAQLVVRESTRPVGPADDAATPTSDASTGAPRA